jgi:RimJ/RimL family protein N-acetyltransferase
MGDGQVSLEQGGLGYAINPDFQRMGYATEAANALIRFAFGDLGLSLVYAQCDTRNVASRRVMEKTGTQMAAVLKDHQLVKGVMTDSYRYEIRRED